AGGERPAGAAPPDWSAPAAARFRDAMNDDFNTPVALSVLFDLASDVHRGGPQAADAGRMLRNLAAVLGLLEQAPAAARRSGLHGSDFAEAARSAPDDAAIEAAIAERAAAKAAKDWTRADQIRDALVEQGIVLEDTPGATTWRRA
ncbi:MAG: DALR domain-containing protein, partial [Burkholderiaceae bacterium]